MKSLEDFATTKYNIFLVALKQEKEKTAQASAVSAMVTTEPSTTGYIGY